MVAVSNTVIRELAGLATTDAPSDTALTDFQTEAARYVAVRVGKSSVDPTSCTDGECHVIQLLSASFALTSRPSEGSSAHLDQSSRLRSEAEAALDDLLSSGKLWADILGVNISR
jgi:hypothetical protein